jgi:hypothetical protein
MTTAGKWCCPVLLVTNVIDAVNHGIQFGLWVLGAMPFRKVGDGFILIPLALEHFAPGR